uniref:Uncharacterized protein n=1 Tax=Globisporangium ultimum (strain ATCC 200006 / CBS 805.95 / DAOM BR144) TaxID=431595 RepID=K3WSZ0_GLOUD
MSDSPGGLFSSSMRGSSRFSGGASMLSPTFLDFFANEDKPPSSTANATSRGNDPHDLLLLPPPLSAFSHRPPPTDSTRNAGSSSHRRSTSSAPTSSSSTSATASTSISESTLVADFVTAGKAAASTTPHGFLTTPRIWQEFLSDDFKFDAKALSSSATSGAMDAATQATQASTGSTGSGSGGNSVHIGATTMISEDMSQVSLSAAPSTSAPLEPAVVRMPSPARETRMECDEPMLEALGEEDEEKEEDEEEEGAVEQERDPNRESEHRDERASRNSDRDEQTAASSHRRESAQAETKHAESSSST